MPSDLTEGWVCMSIRDFEHLVMSLLASCVSLLSFACPCPLPVFLLNCSFFPCWSAGKEDRRGRGGKKEERQSNLSLFNRVELGSGRDGNSSTQASFLVANHKNNLWKQKRELLKGPFGGLRANAESKADVCVSPFQGRPLRTSLAFPAPCGKLSSATYMPFLWGIP